MAASPDLTVLFDLPPATANRSGLLPALTALASATDPNEARRALHDCRTALGPEADSYAPLMELLCVRAAELARLRRLAGTDELTGLANRRAFASGLQREVARLERGGQPFGVLLLDLDGLKARNDSLGHAAGDRAIQAAAEAMCDALRATDLPARLGGDELAVLLAETDRTGVEAAAERVRRAIEARVVDGVPLRVSVGAAAADRLGASGEELVGLADMRLYRDKRSRKGRRAA